MTSPAPDRAGTTAEPQVAPSSPLVLAPAPGLEVIGGDAVGFCGPDGCYPAPAGRADESADRPTS